MKHSAVVMLLFLFSSPEVSLFRVEVAALAVGLGAVLGLGLQARLVLELASSLCCRRHIIGACKAGTGDGTVFWLVLQAYHLSL